nr:PREDICTED: ankyrin repeat domain-containing protein 33B [Latimeria chalumnae]|eukprot:XP_006006614.1 PREDICTED: ankyrin repeat domain-containing protein 33B [Latimeria chalumnae]
MVLFTEERKSSGGKLNEAAKGQKGSIRRQSVDSRTVEEEEEEEEDGESTAHSCSSEGFTSEDIADLDEEYEEFEDFSELPDTRSITSDDSFYPPDDGVYLSETEWRDSPESPTPLSFHQACSTNNPIMVKVMIRQGLTEEEVRETDRNGRTGLIVASYQGYVDVVVALAQCPHIDVNWQDKEGNTALITAAQAGHITITNYLLNYYPDLNIERRNVHGFTALMKAAMQGKNDCVRALMLAGADIYVTDSGRKLTPLGWARFTARYDTVLLMQKLLKRPCPEQLCEKYKPEWPKLKELVAKASESKSCFQRISETLRSAININYYHDLEEDGVLDHMVKVTTSLYGPFISPVCRTVCPGSPPYVGKRRLAVQEILKKRRAQERKTQGKDSTHSYQHLFQNSQVLLVPKKRDRRTSLHLLNPSSPQGMVVSTRRSSLLPLHLLRRSSIRPGFVIPKVRVCKAPVPTYQPERVRRKSSEKDTNHLQIPRWRYKELKEERKKAEEEEKKKAEAEKQKKIAPFKKV